MNKLSVIIPAYNAAQFIAENLDSVTTQEASIDYEIIIVNDGSKDDTQTVCKNYIRAHPDVNIRLIHQENAGVSAARNRGIEEATGEWITFLDADDYILPGALGILNDPFILEADIVLCQYTRKPVPCHNYCICGVQLDPLLLASCALRYPKYYKQVQDKFAIDPISNWVCWGKLFRRQWLVSQKIHFPVGIFTSEDFVFLLHAFSLKPRVLGTNMKMYYYRANEQSVTHTYNPQIFDNYCKLFDYLEKNIAFEKNTEDLDAYMAERIVDCIRIYLSCHRAKPKDVLRKQLQVFDQARHIQRILRSPIRNVFVGKKRRIVGTYWLIRMKLAFLISRKNNNENTTC